MLKKIIVILAMLALLGLSFVLIRKTPNNNNIVVSENNETVVQEEALPEDTYIFNTQNLVKECSLDKPLLCAVENAVKCTINPAAEYCDKTTLPKFIFMTDQTIDRPTEISYKYLSKKPLPNNTVEIYTESNCNGTWFGLCQGTVIYVLAPKEKDANNWIVKDIYAIE